MSRNFVFTLNNYTPKEVAALSTLGNDNSAVRYCCFGYEIAPTTGTPHLQGYMELSRTMKLAQVHKFHGCSRLALLVRRGTREQARDYCRKDGPLTESGCWERGGQGKRNDIKALRDAIYGGATYDELFNGPYCVCAARHLKFVEKCFQLSAKLLSRKKRDVDVFVHYGAAGTGKSSVIDQLFPCNFKINCSDTFPFDGYDGEDVVVIDDFYGNLPYHLLLNILDEYQLRLNVKGGHTYARWTKVFITSNKAPHEWYPNVGFTDALARRIHSVTRFEEFVLPLEDPTEDLSEDVVDQILAKSLGDGGRIGTADTVDSIEVPGGNIYPRPSLSKHQRCRGVERLLRKMNMARRNFSTTVYNATDLRSMTSCTQSSFSSLREKWSTHAS